MGDMADMCMWDERDLHGDDEPMAPAFKTCRYCHKGGFEWGMHDGKWRLFDRSGVHRCVAKPLPETPKPRAITDPVEKAFRAGFDVGYRSAMDRVCPDVGIGSVEISVEDGYEEYIQS